MPNEPGDGCDPCLRKWQGRTPYYHTFWALNSHRHRVMTQGANRGRIQTARHSGRTHPCGGCRTLADSERYWASARELGDERLSSTLRASLSGGGSPACNVALYPCRQGRPLLGNLAYVATARNFQSIDGDGCRLRDLQRSRNRFLPLGGSLAPNDIHTAGVFLWIHVTRHWVRLSEEVKCRFVRRRERNGPPRGSAPKSLPVWLFNLGIGLPTKGGEPSAPPISLFALHTENRSLTGNSGTDSHALNRQRPKP